MTGAKNRFVPFVPLASDWLWETDTAGRYTYVSGNALERFAFADDGAAEQLRIDFLRPSSDGDADAIRAFIRELKSFADIEIEIRLPDGQPLHISCSGAPFYTADGMFAGYRGIARDITERIEARKETPHEPTSIRVALSAAQRAAELTARLLAVSYDLPVAPVMCDIGEVIEDLSGLIGRTMGAKVEIRIAREDNLPPVFVDLSRLEAALLNLALNGREAMLDGGSLTLATALLSLSDVDDPQHRDILAGDYVLVVVTDTGSNLPAGTTERLVEPFVSTEEVANGLGLSTAYRFCQQSETKMTIQARPDLGTTVRLYFPVADTDPSSQSM